MASLDITKQNNPDFLDMVNQYSAATVSIVSIQTDQSRLEEGRMDDLATAPFQSYQSRQINPDE